MILYSVWLCLIVSDIICQCSSQLFWEGKLDKPKEEIETYMDLNVCTLVGLRYHIFSTHPPYPYMLFSWAQHSSPPWWDSLCHRWTNRNWTQKDSTYNSLKCEVEKKGSEVKVKTSIQSMLRLVFTWVCGMVNDTSQLCVCWCAQ